MKHRTLATCMALVVLSLPVRAWAQAEARSPRAERNAAGTLMNQDYFTAELYPEVKLLLGLVHLGHFDERVFQNFRQGDIAWAKSDCDYVLEKFPNHPGALHMMGEIGKRMNQPGLVIPYFERALREYPQYAYTHAQYGRYLVEQGGVTAGILELKEALRLDPSFVVAKAWLEDAERRMGPQPTSPRTPPGP